MILNCVWLDSQQESLSHKCTSLIRQWKKVLIQNKWQRQPFSSLLLPKEHAIFVGCCCRKFSEDTDWRRDGRYLKKAYKDIWGHKELMLNVKVVSWWPVTINPTLWKQSAGLSQERFEPALHNEFQATHCYIARFCLKAGKERRGDRTGRKGKEG